MATERVTVDLDRRGQAGYQVSINVSDDKGAGHGYRILGPKYAGDSEHLAHETLTARDASEIRTYLDLVDLPEGGSRYTATLHGPKPTIVCLCGSTRFGNFFREANLRETVAGRVVLSIGCDTKSDADLDLVAEADDGRTLDEIKAALDLLHKRKIELADEVLVVSDPSGYFGDSTRSEIAHAVKLGKPVRWMHEAARARWENGLGAA